MTRNYFAALASGGIGALSVFAFCQVAFAAPDLVIQKEDTTVEFGSCELSEPLVKGRLVIRNEGDSDANLRQAEDFFRSFTAVYVPENIDLIDKGKKRTKMEPREQRSVEFEVGRNKLKRGRNFNAYAVVASSSSEFPSEQQDLSESQVKQIQALLKDRGFRISVVDGDWGRQTSNAMRSFQRASSISPADGRWNEETAAVVTELLGGPKTETGNEKDGEGRTKITIFAVVDPYNLIEESNEANNIETYTGYLECD